MSIRSPRSSFRFILLSTAACFLVTTFAAAQESTPAPAPVFVRPAPVMQDGKFMPGSGNEGIITARYTVKADGTTSDIQIVGGFTNPTYENMIKETIGKWTFTPGTVNGEPKDFLNQEYTFNIRVAEQLSISPNVASEIDGINALIVAKDYTKALSSIDSVLANEAHSVFDYALMNQMRTAVEMGMEDPFTALVNIRKATMSAENAAGEPAYMLTSEILQNALKQHLMMAAAIRQHGEVVRTWNVMDGLYDLPATDELHQLVSTSEQQLASPDPLASLGKIVDGSWNHVPTRRIFTVADVREGTLEKVIARCERRTLELDYQADVDWSLPPSVGECKVEFTGSDGTLFTVYEFLE